MVKNPLRKRYIRELKGDFGKYIVIFLLLVLCIGFVSGFMVADGSMLRAYNESFTKYRIEDGHFVSEKKMNVAKRNGVESLGIKTYDLFYTEEDFDNDTTIRIYEKRNEVNLECLMEGEYPEGLGEIAIDRMYADNNDLSLGDTLTDNSGNTYVITGLVALSDYSCLFQNNNDIMFDALKFSVAVVSEEQFKQYDEGDITWCYAWKYNDASIVDSDKEEDTAKQLMKDANAEVTLKSWIPRYQNQAITFTGEDMGSDAVMMVTFLYIVVVIIAFVFAITTKDTIRKESTVIGTLRASGFTVNELVRHYLVMPVLVTLISALVGNILGYTVIKDVCVAMYYKSYSLPAYVTIWSGEAFLETTLVPCLLMALVTRIVLGRNLKLPVKQFLHGELSKKKNRKALRLNHKIPFITRFRTRVTLQNVSSYLLLFIGIAFGNFLLMFGLAFPALLTDYQDTVAEHMLAEYQTILTVPSTAMDEDKPFQSMLKLLQFSKAVQTENESAEKFSLYTLNTVESEEARTEEIMLYGIVEDSKYVSLPGPGVYISSLYADKYEIGTGDFITLKEEYEDTSYTFEIAGVIDYEGAVCVFMPMKELNETFELGDDFFAGYFSDTPIEDVSSEYIGSVIDYDALTKVSRQLMVSMGSFMYILDGFCVVMFIILMYLLSKLMIEKNTQSISMAKILGYSNREINRLYIRSLTVATVVCIALSIPLCYVVLIQLYRVLMKQMMSGWLMIAIKPKIMITMACLGILSYGVVAILEMKQIRKIPMDQALKNVE